MQCPECDSLITENTGVCSHCGTRFVPKRVRLDPSEKDFSLEAEQVDSELFEACSNNLDEDFPPRPEVIREQPVEQIKPENPSPPHWGGFIRRSSAFLIDVIVILAFGLFMFLLSYIGYKVGLSAHGKSVTVENSPAFFFIFTWGWIGVSALYFVVFHGMGGKTIGKALLGLRVVGADKAAITYKQAFIRWLSFVGFAPVLLGFLWVLFSREKRAWHDIIARTWVIRD